MRVSLVKTRGSVFNRSIWEGLARALRKLNHDVQAIDEEDLEAPADPLPDLLFSVHGGGVDPELVTRYRSAGVATAVYLLDEPYEVDRSTEWSRAYEWVFSVDRATVAIHAAESRAAFLPLGFDPVRFSDDGKRYASEVLVLGSPFASRLQLLAPLREEFGRYVTWVGLGWRPFCAEGRHVEQLVSPDICARFYRGASIIVNLHRDSLWSHFGQKNSNRIEATHLNPRFWEAAACGGFQLASYRDDAPRFAPELVTFRTPDELGALLEHYRSRPSLRAEIARRTRLAVMPHHYPARVEEMLTVIAAGGPGSRPGLDRPTARRPDPVAHG